DRLLTLRQDTSQLRERARGDDHAEVAGGGLAQGGRADGEAEAIGRGEGQRVAGKGGQDTGEDGPRVVRGGGEDDAVDHAAQEVGGHGGRGLLANGGDERELVGVQAADVGFDTRARDGRGVRLVGLRQVHTVVG